MTQKVPEQFTVAAGKHNLRLKETTERIYSVERIFTYPKGTDQFLEYDIALIYVTEDIAYNKYVKPVCLADTKPDADQTCVITGWGKTKKFTEDGIALREGRALGKVLSQGSTLYYAQHRRRLGPEFGAT